MLDAELAAQIDHRLGEPVGDLLLISEPVDAHAPWPAAVFVSHPGDGDLDIGNGTEQRQIAERVLDMLMVPLARPATAVAVQRDTFSRLQGDVDLVRIALAALHADHLKALPRTECTEQRLALVHDMSSITCDRPETTCRVPHDCVPAE